MTDPMTDDLLERLEECAMLARSPRFVADPDLHRDTAAALARLTP
jgi:hypothetical protein